MATAPLQAESAPGQPSQFDHLYAAHKQAKASWDAATYAPDNIGKDLPNELDMALCERNSQALNALLLSPVTTSYELLRKLRVFRDEEVCDGWFMAGQIVEQLVRDARHVAEFGDK